MATKQFEIPDVGTVSMYKRRGNRSMRLSVTSSGQIRVSLPMWVPYRVAEQFVRAKKDWINQQRPSDIQLLKNGDRVGRGHVLYFEQRPDDGSITTQVNSTIVRISFGRNEFISSDTVQAKANAACIRALKKEAEALLPPRLKILSEQTGLGYRSVGVKPLKSRWGSCDSNKDILLNLYLVQLPWHLIDYVLVHELVHTEVMRHGPPFWQKMQQYLPHAKSLRSEMKNYHPTLRVNSSVVQ